MCIYIYCRECIDIIYWDVYIYIHVETSQELQVVHGRYTHSTQWYQTSPTISQFEGNPVNIHSDMLWQSKKVGGFSTTTSRLLFWKQTNSWCLGTFHLEPNPIWASKLVHQGYLPWVFVETSTFLICFSCYLGDIPRDSRFWTGGVHGCTAFAWFLFNGKFSR